MAGKRHGTDEIEAKLSHADELAAKGKTHREISKALGVSVMTYHRWRKMREEPARPGPDRGREARSFATSDDGRAGFAPTADDDRLRELELENTRLRRLVTDLLLDKVKLEE